MGEEPALLRDVLLDDGDQNGGAEIDCSLLFADVRGSTALAETMRPQAFKTLLNRFYETAAAVLYEHDAMLDKFVGDEVVAIFIPALSGDRHAARAVAAAKALLHATGHDDPGGPWLPIGAGIQTGIAYVGAVGDGPSTVLTALGDTVNVAARLASAAGAGEVVISEDVARAADLDMDAGERRSLDLKGKSASVAVVVLGAKATVAGSGARHSAATTERRAPSRVLLPDMYRVEDLLDDRAWGLRGAECSGEHHALAIDVEDADQVDLILRHAVCPDWRRGPGQEAFPGVWRDQLELLAVVAVEAHLGGGRGGEAFERRDRRDEVVDRRANRRIAQCSRAGVGHQVLDNHERDLGRGSRADPQIAISWSSVQALQPSGTSNVIGLLKLSPRVYLPASRTPDDGKSVVPA